jgi:DNA polymerase-4
LKIFDKLWRHCEASDIRGRTVTLKVKYADFQTITRSRTLPEPLTGRADLEEVSLALLAPLIPVSKGVRLLGVTLSTLEEEEPERVAQMTLAL